MIFNKNIFETALGKRLYHEAERAVLKFSMSEKLSSGTLIGFSGGADSLFLLLFLIEWRKRENLNFKISALHVNHMIRGDEALRDECFSKETAESLGVEFNSVKLDVPAYAQSHSIGIEEAARILRYDAFDSFVSADKDLSSIAVAHNAGDNFETVLFNMVRGTGLRGISGILPVRNNIVRPIIFVSKNDILKLFDENGIEYVTDSTNFSTDYTRNYIRNEIIPKFSNLSENPEKSITRLTTILRDDNAYIEECAEKYIKENLSNNSLDAESLSKLHPALLSRVVALFLKMQGVIDIEYIHINSIKTLLPGGNFKVSLPKNRIFVSEGGSVYVDEEHEEIAFCKKLELGLNKIPNFEDVIYVSLKKLDKTSLNVYKISIQAKLPFDIINDVLYVRSKNDGDAYRYSGMTRKLKKLFNDRDVPPSCRSRVPVFFGNDRIVWVPGFGIGESTCEKEIFVYILTDTSRNNKQAQFYIPKNN